MVDFMTHDPFCQGTELLCPVEIRSGNGNECPSQRNLVKVMCHFRTEMSLLMFSQDMEYSRDKQFPQPRISNNDDMKQSYS